MQIVKRITELEKAGASHSQKHVLTKVKVDIRDCFFYLKSGAIAEVCHVSSDDMYLCNILLPHQLHKLIYFEIYNGYVPVPLVTEVKWKDNIA